MKIAYLLGSLSRGGTETLLLDVFRNSAEAGFEFIGLHRKEGVLKNDFYETSPKFFKLCPWFPFDIVYLFKLRKILKKENIQIVHAQQPLDALYAWITTRFSTIKVVQTFHGFDDFRRKNIIISLASRLVNKNFYVSYFQKEYYEKKYNLNPNKQSVIYNGISFDKFDSINNNIVPDFLQKDSKQIRLKMAMVGNFVRGREQNTICKFLKSLHDKGVAFDFYFVGKKSETEPWLYDDCVQYCKENGLTNCVYFIGSRNDVPAILKNIDAFVYSTDHDTFGIAVVEAIAVGVPVFVNNWGVMKEITNDGEWATLYETKNDQDLLAKFLFFLQYRDEFVEKTQKASLSVRDKFSIKRHLQELEKFYKLLLNA